MMVDVVGVRDSLVVVGVVGGTEDVVGGVELVVGTLDDVVEVVLSTEEEVGMAELVVGSSVDEVVGGCSVLGIEVELEAIANCLKTSFRGRLRFRSRSAGTQCWDCFAFGKSVGRALCLFVDGGV